MIPDQLRPLMLHVLAECDAILPPCRLGERRTHKPANLYFARKHFRDLGLPFRAEEVGGAGRVAGHRLLAEAARVGLLTVCRRKSIRWPCVKPTEAGELAARRLAGLPGLAATLGLMAEIDRLAGDHLLWEFWLHDRYSREQARAVEDMALPGLWRGWIVAESTLPGNVYYALTKSGAEALATLDPSADGDDDYDSESAKEYERRLNEARERLLSAEPEDVREIGDVGIPASIPDPPRIQEWLKNGGDLLPEAKRLEREGRLDRVGPEGQVDGP